MPGMIEGSFLKSAIQHYAQKEKIESIGSGVITTTIQNNRHTLSGYRECNLEGDLIEEIYTLGGKLWIRRGQNAPQEVKLFASYQSSSELFL